MAGEPSYPPLSPIRAGIGGSCPRCGKGALFDGYLTVAERCRSCGLSFAFADAGDGAAWFVMLVSGAAAVAAALFVELRWQPSYWAHAAVALAFAVILPLLLLRPVKGILLCQQYRTEAEEGRPSL
ncbi:MAG: DUF983 domain-containing protein [Aestuariivirgaceae bacterium]